MSTPTHRLAVLFGPRRGVTREVRQRVLVGRAPEAELQLIDEKVSREHCVFEPRGEQVVVSDLGSRNGTWVNGERLTAPRVLTPSDTVGVGETLIALSDDVEALLARDGDSTLIMSRGPLGLTTTAVEPGADAFARAGKLLLEAALATSGEEAATRLSRALAAGLSCDETLVCTRTPEGAWRPWLGLPAGAVMSINPSLAEFAVRQQRAVSVEEAQARALRDERTTRVARSPAFVLCAPLLSASGAMGVVFASRRAAFDSQELALATVLAQAATPALRLEPAGADARAPTERFVAESPSMREAVRMARQVAASASTVLLTGESGTGKEVLAALIHRESKRSRGPFVALNCGALARELAESELFGHEKGSFTGAQQQHAGVFERADGGTLFLDELGELPLELQVKLLRVLEERLVWRVGARVATTVDVRIVCATNRALEKDVEAGRFRADLFWRVNVVRIGLAPLRERREDIGPLAQSLVARHARSLGRPTPALSADTIAALEQFGWPGNVRQLSNALERALVLKVDDGPVSLADLPPEVLAPVGVAPSGAPRTLASLIAALEREQVLLAMQRARGVKAQAAEVLGISRPTLDRKLDEYGIDWLGEGPR